MTTEPKCNSFYCQRKHQCGRYENTHGSSFKTYFEHDMSRPWLCFVPKIADDCEDEPTLKENVNIALNQIDIMDFDLNKLVRTI